MLLIIPTKLRKGTRRRSAPFDLTFDPETSPTRASHGMNFGRTVAHPITADFPLLDEEQPALIHFATCPARHRKTA